jgi:hypothetical protein
MTAIAVRPGYMLPTRSGAELFWEELSRKERRLVDRLLKLPELRRKIQVLQMAGSDANYLSKKFGDLIFGATAYTAPTPVYGGLWTAALDDTFTGATASEANYTSYARLSLTNNTTIFAVGSGTTTYTKTFPSDAYKNFATATGGSSTCTYIGFLDGNLGTSADHGLIWATITSVTIGNGATPQLAQNAVSQTRD